MYAWVRMRDGELWDNLYMYVVCGREWNRRKRYGTKALRNLFTPQENSGFGK